MSDPLRRMLSLHDFEAAARRILPKPLYAYVSGAVEDGQSERGNRRAYDDYGFRPKVLVDVSRRSTRCTVLGREYAAPVGVAPMGIAALTSYRGDVMLARAAAEAGVPCIMSGSSLIRLETVMEAAPGTWFQAYLPGDGAQIAALIDRVAAAGVDTLVLTVDTPVAANRENNVRAGFSTPLRPSVGLAWQGVTHPRWLIGTFLRTLARHGMPHFENNYATRGAPILSGNVLRDFSDRGHLNWQHVAAIRKTWKGRMVLKGILHPDDARAARAHGMDAVIVSNHGGRQLDGSVSPLHALPAIVDAAGGMDVMLDSGVRRGTDALKAMALGARCVFVGRPFNYAATVAGQRGVAHAIALIVEEIRRNMGLLGIVDLREVNQSLLQPGR
ncbi:alpha-hydroxy-acid oxidizing enzyme [Achromobacter xylosoxidans]|uniref:alpha-hydroxy acid oxidase n=1 Tax=Alcaligenes xylosoxydans xylosoxydans TaxID=85698 RepID=UPI0003D67B4A|nr:alpha-hydroxy acid oxidase [Achromobacter xylosoxidans]AHC46682.1 L-lactate dehydrogenase [Achromobacter xylosoxidans NBRC 15126 = ATCC 27061]OFL38129.1 alpha-hydroxy-acid oxidizing enzyme [Achromobacter xylosoxidans]OFS34274.1 alpha-hydroxy-acid oxidizing enzyme [Achromobacter xylosoxidans]QKQ56877.1 alpha-hydroxy-acid oxidizing protein [Achromobacter xylosoxidans]QPR93968.1 alpha-hydroxy-acid oxidizing protein [Achromobacter xylosoxidans]